MRGSEKHKKHIQLFLKGANYHTDPEIVGLMQGVYRDAFNFRVKGEVLERIKGEEILYDGDDNGYVCIGATEVNYHIFEVWVRTNNSAVIFRIDGQVMLLDSSNKLGLSSSRPLQLTKSDDCKGGEIFFTDNFQPPYYFSVQDIIDNFVSGNHTYFSGLDPQAYQVLLYQTLNIPVLDDLVLIGGTAGLKLGEYSYAIAYVDSIGNVTQYSPPTPLIPVPLSHREGSFIYPLSDTYSGNTGTVSPYGIRIRFRVDNKLNYKYIRVKRIAFTDNQALGYVPVAEFIDIPQELLTNEFSVRTFTDLAGLDWLPLTDEETVVQLSAIKSCKAIKYYQGHLVLGNIKLHSRDIQGEVEYKRSETNKYGYPFIDKLGSRGYSDVFNSTYKKTYPGGEKYGFGIVCWDSFGNNSLVDALPDDVVVNLQNFMFPNRRDPLSAESFAMSETNWKGVPRASDVNNNDNIPVHEVFTKGSQKKGITSRTSIHKNSYIPLTPQRPGHFQTGLQAVINPKVHVEHNLFINDPLGGLNYNPNFGIDYYAMGLALEGVLRLPSWCVGFSIVRTKPAGRVVSQGIVTYKMYDEPQNRTQIVTSGYKSARKHKDQIAYFSDDVAQGYSGVPTAQHKIQLVSPLGFFAEAYSHNKRNVGVSTGTYNNNIDMILYAREMVTNPLSDVSPQLDGYNGTGVAYWTRFNRWRNSVVSPATANPIGISGVTYETFKSVGRGGYYVINTASSIYATDRTTVGDRLDANATDTRNFHEPFYIANIINEGANIVTQNISEYIHTGHYQKVISKIGLGTDEVQTIRLVDERWQDCIVNPHSATRDTDDVFLYVKDETEQAWLDVTYKSILVFNQIRDSLTTNGYYDTPTKRIYGVYRSGMDVNEFGRIHFVNFPNLNKIYSLPANNAEIIVRYDNRFPLRIFGGDNVVGESIFPLVDGQTKSNGDDLDNNQLYAYTPLPYAGFRVRDNYDIIENSDPSIISLGGTFETVKGIPCSIIRQLLVCSIVSCKSHLPYSTQLGGTGDVCNDALYIQNNAFPRVHYIQRPNKWNENCGKNFSDDGGDISVSYKNHYPGEFAQWMYGGFRFRQLALRDYSVVNTYDKLFSKPEVGFEEETEFCSRVMWSVKRNINEQNSPSLKTFLSLNVFDISDDSHEITYLFENNSDRGNNLLTLTGSGLCLLVTDKRIITQMTAQELTTIPADRLITGEIWISKSIGCPSNMWRGIAEYNNMLFFPNSESIYKVDGGAIQDIGKINNRSYYDRIYPVLKNVNVGYDSKMTGVYNPFDDEYWLHINNNPTYEITGTSLVYLESLGVPNGGTLIITGNTKIIMPHSIGGVVQEYYMLIKNSCVFKLSLASNPFAIVTGLKRIKISNNGLDKAWTIQTIDTIDFPKLDTGETFVFKNQGENSFWMGTYGYNADKFIVRYGKEGNKSLDVLAMRNYDTYRLGYGDQINSTPIKGIVKYILSPEGYVTKEFIDQTYNSTLSPDYVAYGNELDNEEARQYKFKNYTRAFYTQIPRKQTESRSRFQGNFMEAIYVCEKLGSLKLRTVETGYKIIK